MIVYMMAPNTLAHEYELGISTYQGRCRLLLTHSPPYDDNDVALSLSVVFSLAIDYSRAKQLNGTTESIIKGRLVIVSDHEENLMGRDFVTATVQGVDADGRMKTIELFVRKVEAKQLEQRWAAVASYYLPGVGRHEADAQLTDINISVHLGKLSLTEFNSHTGLFVTHENARAYSAQRVPDSKHILLTIAIYYGDPTDTDSLSKQFFRFTLSEQQWAQVAPWFTECMDATRSIEFPRR